MRHAPRLSVRSALLQVVLLLASASPGSAAAADNSADWPNVGNDKGGMRFSPLTQTDRSNVSKLRLAWEFHTRDAGEGTTIECTPVVVDGVMYVTTVRTRMVALDPATDDER